MSEIRSCVRFMWIKEKPVRPILFLVVICGLAVAISSCGGGGGGGGGTSNPAAYGNLDGYVYVPVGSGARVAEAAPAGCKPAASVRVTAVCGATTKYADTNSSGYFKITSLPAGNCSVSVSKSGYTSHQTTIAISANNTATIGGTSGLTLAPATSGSIKVIANVSGGEVLIDGEETNITIPASLSYTFLNISPGNHTISISQTGFDAVSPQSIPVSQGQIAEVTFNMNPTGNRAPTANAGADQKGFIGTKYIYGGWSGTQYIFTPTPITVLLDGTRSADPDGNRLSYRWHQESGPTVEIDKPNSATTTFIPMNEGTYTFSLKVSDGYLESASDTVNLHIAMLSGKLAFVCAYKSTGSTEICTMNADGSNLSYLMENYTNDTNPCWSPDGGGIAYVCNPSSTAEICTINSNGTGYTQITNNAEYNYVPGWSPDGNRILWIKGAISGGQLFSMKTDGTDVSQITSFPQTVGFHEYSPDGTKMLFTSDYGGDNWEVSIMNADGSNITRLTNNATVEMYAVWMPDGRIFYTSENFIGDQTRHLYVMKVDGTGQQEIPIPTGVRDVWNPTVSSDGRFIFFSNNDGLWVMYADGSEAMNYGLGGGNPDYRP